MKEAEEQIQRLTQSCSKSTAQLQAQIVELERCQKAEATACSEKDELQLQLKQAQEKIQDLEQRLAPPGELQCVQEPTSNIVPFATIENRLSSQIEESPFGDAGDFAMLFMSDDPLSVAAFEKEKSNEPQENIRPFAEDSQMVENGPNDPGAISDNPQSSQRPTKGKRKGDNLETKCSSINIEDRTNMQHTSIEPQKAMDERPNKVSKHVHKWTYSRVHSSETQIQEEKSAVPAHAAAAPGRKRLSPKGLVSASSGGQTISRPSNRGRGRHRSRGT